MSEAGERLDQARLSRAGYWFALLVFGIIVAGSVPFYRVPRGYFVLAQLHPGLDEFGGDWPSRGLAYYWLVAMPAGYLLVLAWYDWRSRRIGARMAPAWFSVCGLGLTGLLLLAGFVGGDQLSITGPGYVIWFLGQGLLPLAVLAVALWVLACTERSWALAVVALVFTLVAVVLNGGPPGFPAGPYFGVGSVVVGETGPAALTLLASGLIAWLAQRRQASPPR